MLGATLRRGKGTSPYLPRHLVAMKSLSGSSTTPLCVCCITRVCCTGRAYGYNQSPLRSARCKHRGRSLPCHAVGSYLIDCYAGASLALLSWGASGMCGWSVQLSTPRSHHLGPLRRETSLLRRGTTTVVVLIQAAKQPNSHRWFTSVTHQSRQEPTMAFLVRAPMLCGHRSCCWLIIVREAVNCLWGGKAPLRRYVVCSPSLETYNGSVQLLSRGGAAVVATHSQPSQSKKSSHLPQRDSACDSQAARRLDRPLGHY